MNDIGMFKEQQEDSVAQVGSQGCCDRQGPVHVGPYTPSFLLRSGNPSWESSAKRSSLRTKVT